MVLKTFIKDPDATLDYAFDWSEWLQESETISTYTLTVESGITKEGDNEADGIVTVWLSGGTIGTTYIITCKVTTNLSRTDERSAEIIMVNR